MTNNFLIKTFGATLVVATALAVFGAAPASARNPACDANGVCADIPGAQPEQPRYNHPHPQYQQQPQQQYRPRPQYVPQQPQYVEPQPRYERHRNEGGFFGGPVIVQPQIYDAPVYAEPGYAPGQWVQCARENGVCDVPYSTRVRYGSRGYYTFLDVDGPVRCNNGTFGDPARGALKHCWYLSQ